MTGTDSADRKPARRKSEQRTSEDRERLGAIVSRRPRVGAITSVTVSLVFALVATPIILAESWLIGDLTVGEPAPITVRVPPFTGFADDQRELVGGPIVVARGETVDQVTHEVIAAVRGSRPSGLGAWGAQFAAMFLLALVYTAHLRRSHRGGLLRTQAVTLMVLLALAAITQASLLLTPILPDGPWPLSAPVSVLIAPIAGIAVLAALVVDLSVGLATGLAASVLIGLLVPFDLGVIGVLAVQSGTAVFVVGEGRRRPRRVILGCLAGGVAAAIAYGGVMYLSQNISPLAELNHLDRSAWVAAATGGVTSALVAVFGVSLYQYLLGEITQSKLVELEDLSHPLLMQIAEKSPGTWQHSLAMANMAEIAANTIGGNGRLIRVGAYYHDLGKSLQSKYFIENLDSGEESPHDRLPPEVSCDAIFAHVTEGIRIARKHGLPERIIDFMHMHHGDGLLEYFWGKCKEMGNPKELTEDDFRYPGIPPQSRETAILAICDAVEAASRTLKNPDEHAIKNLVQRIVYGKLHLGQLDQSGLSMADLRKISESLQTTIKHAHHGRIEYPWQREQRAREAAEASQAAIAVSAVAEPIVPSGTQRMVQEPRLDSLGVPRPYWRQRVRKPDESDDSGSSSSGASGSGSSGSGSSGSDSSGAASGAMSASSASGSSPAASPASSSSGAAAASGSSTGDAGERGASDRAAASLDRAATTKDEPAVILLERRTGSAASERRNDDRAAMPSAARPTAPLLESTPSAEQVRQWDLTVETNLQAFPFGDRTIQTAAVPEDEPAPLPDPPSESKRMPPPPPGSSERLPRGTIELMKDRDSEDDGTDERLAPGMMVMGPPPATRPDGDS